jgi:hypothetical protein
MTQSSYFGLYPSPNFLRKHNLSVGGSLCSGKEAPILVYPLDRAILSHCITKSSCLNKRQKRACLMLTDTIFLFWTYPESNFLRNHISVGGFPFSGKACILMYPSDRWAGIAQYSDSLWSGRSRD